MCAYIFFNCSVVRCSVVRRSNFSLRGLSNPASHLQKFLGGCEAEMLEGEVGRELRAVKRGIE